MAIGFGIVTVALLATFAKYFTKLWFIWVIGVLIIFEIGMFANAGSQKKLEVKAELASGSKTSGSPMKEGAPASGGPAKA